MNSLKDYVDWVARSMGVVLNDRQLKRIAVGLTDNKQYIEMLQTVEQFITHENNRN